MYVSCNYDMHNITECTALLSAVISVIKEQGVNVMLLCNKHVDKNERDNIIRGRALVSFSEELTTHDLGDILKNVEKMVTDLVDRKTDEALQTTCEKLEKTHVVAVKKSKETGITNASQRTHKGKPRYNISESWWIQGVSEDPSKSAAENFVLINATVNDILDTMGVKTSALEIKRLGMFDAVRKKPQTLQLTLPHD